MSDQEMLNDGLADTEDPSIALDRDFIAKYKSFRELWDSHHIEYNNKVFRNRALNELLKILNVSNPEEKITLVHVRRKINTLRSTYRRELKKHLLSKTGSSGQESYTYMPHNWKFYELQFLGKEFMNLEDKLNNTTYDDLNSIDTLDNETNGNETFEDAQLFDIKDKHTITRIKISKKRKPDTIEHLIITDDLKDNKLNSIATNVTYNLKRMDHNQRCHAELLINKILLHGVRNNLNYRTNLNNIHTGY